MFMHFFIWKFYLHVILGKTNPDFLSILSFVSVLVVLIVLLHYVIEVKVLSLFSLLCKQFYLISMEHCVIQTLLIIMLSVKCFKRYCLKFSCTLYLCLVTSTDTASVPQIGFNGGVPITEEFFIKNISGKHNEELCGVLLPNWDLQRARKFMDDKEAFFRR